MRLARMGGHGAADALLRRRLSRRYGGAGEEPGRVSIDPPASTHRKSQHRVPRLRSHSASHAAAATAVFLAIDQSSSPPPPGQMAGWEPTNKRGRAAESSAPSFFCPSLIALSDNQAQSRAPDVSISSTSQQV